MKGGISTVHLIGWAMSISLFLGGIFWAKINMTDAQVDKVKADQSSAAERIARIEEAVTNLKGDTGDIKMQLNEVLRRLK